MDVLIDEVARLISGLWKSCSERVKSEERRLAVFFGNNEVGINCVDFCHDSAITKQALMALTAPKIENLRNF